MNQYNKLAGSESSSSPSGEQSSLYGRTDQDNKNSCLRTLLYVVIVSAGIYAVVILFRARRSSGPLPGDPDIPLNTTTPSCKDKVCKEVVDVMDLSADPCSDFYQFSCGKWNSKYPAPRGSQHWTNFVRLDRKNLEIIRKALEGRGKNKFKSKLMSKVRSFYKVCKSRDDETIKDTRKFVLKLVKGLNLNISKENPEKDLAEISSRLLQDFGVSVFFKLSVGINDKKSSEHILKIDQPQLTLPHREDYVTENTTKREINKKAELDYMVRVHQLLNGNDKVEDKDVDVLKSIVDLEYEISAVELKPGEHRVTEHEAKLVTVAEMNTNFKYLDWEVFVKKSVKSPDGKSVRRKEKMILSAPSYFRNVSSLLSNLLKSEQGRKRVEKFLVWKVFDSLVPILTLPFRQARQDLTNSLANMKHRSLSKSSWKSCIKETGKMFKFAVGHIYVKETESDDQDTKTENVKKIFLTVKKALVANLKSNPWMDKETKAKAVEKSKLIEGLIGYPDLVMDTEKLKRMYAHLPVDFHSFPQALLSLTSRMNSPAKLMARLRKPVADHSWMTAPETINAFYTAVMNEIIIPLGILQPPFYKSSRPEVLNFGAIGFSIGHELSHAFDDNGRKYGGEGNLEDWWSRSTTDQFKQHTQCLVDQYDNLTLGGSPVHGRNTLGENIADNGGIKAAYRGYFKDKRLKNNFPIKHLNFTSEQLFFIGYAQVWCNGNTEEYEKVKMVSNPHPPSKVRVQATLANSEEFSKAFECGPGRMMNPDRKCKVW